VSGLAPESVYVAVALAVTLALGWCVAKGIRARRATRVLAISFGGVATVSALFLIIDKTVGVGYTEGLYLAIAVMVLVGICAGVALRRTLA